MIPWDTFCPFPKKIALRQENDLSIFVYELIPMIAAFPLKYFKLFFFFLVPDSYSHVKNPSIITQIEPPAELYLYKNSIIRGNNVTQP